MNKILITGAAGLIGSNLCKLLIKRNDKITILTRNISKAKKIVPGASEYIIWNYEKPEQWEKHLLDKDAVIHLAGANLFNKRWNKKYKKIIWESRIKSSQNIVNAIKKIPRKPKVYLSASGIGYYGERGDKPLTEERPPGVDFIAKLCFAWESEAAKVEESGVRRVSVRTAAVLSPDEGALKEFLTPFKLFVGGPLGNGTQWFSWIHLKDIVRAYIFALDNEAVKGSVNASSPNPVRMKVFAKTLGKVLNRPSFFNVPEIVLKIVVGEVAKSVTCSIKVIPQKLIQNNFNFEFENLEDSLKDLLKAEF